jgi:hypothetical protein
MQKRGRGRPPKPPEIKGEKIGPRVLPVTIDALVEIAEITGEPQGTVLDRLIAKEHKRVIRKESQ